MPRDLFGDVVRPSVRIASRKWYSLPLAVGLHALVIAALIIVPLLATGRLPGLPPPSAIFVEVLTPEPPAGPPPMRKTGAQAVPAENPNAAPVNVPTGVGPESGMTRDPEIYVDTGVAGGLPTPVEGVGIAVPPEAPPPAAPSAPLRISSGIKPPTKIKDVKPSYPDIAIKARVSGVVIIEATIDVTGRVIEAKILRGIPLLDQAALDAVRQWRFTPTRLNGVPVPVVMTVTVQFWLQ